jgi:dTMP kinase
MKKGKLIVFEGISGTGKETQAKLLQNYLSSKRITSRIVFHPSPELKKILTTWRKERSIDWKTEVYLLLADRHDHVQRVITPTLKKGEWIISLRSWISALVYQAKTNQDRIWVSKEFSRFEPTPDYFFYFFLTPNEAMERIMQRHKKTDEVLGKFETEAALNEKLETYQSVLKNISYTSVDSSYSIDAMHKNIRKLIR